MMPRVRCSMLRQKKGNTGEEFFVFYLYVWRNFLFKRYPLYISKFIAHFPTPFQNTKLTNGISPTEREREREIYMLS